MVIDVPAGGGFLNRFTAFSKGNCQVIKILVRSNKIARDDAPLGQVFSDPDTLGCACFEAYLVDFKAGSDPVDN